MYGYIVKQLSDGQPVGYLDGPKHTDKQLQVLLKDYCYEFDLDPGDYYVERDPGDAEVRNDGATCRFCIRDR